MSTSTDYCCIVHSSSALHWKNEQTTAFKISTIYQCWMLVRCDVTLRIVLVNTASFSSHIIDHIRFNESTLWTFRSLHLLHLSFDFFYIWSKLHCLYRMFINACVCIHFVISTLFLFIFLPLIHVVDPLIETLVARSVEIERIKGQYAQFLNGMNEICSYRIH